VSARLLAAVLLLVGSLLIFPRLGTQSLWVDEGLTVGPALAATGLPDLVARVRQVDTQPPGSHLVLYALRDVLPRSELGFRLPSFVAVEIGLALFYVLLRRLWGAPTALIALALAQHASYLAFFAAEARNYGLWFLLIVASLLLALLWHERAYAGRRGAAACALAWGLVNGLGMWTHLFHACVMVGELAVVFAIVLARPSDLRAPGRYLLGAVLSLGVTVLLAAPWLVILAHGAATGQALGVSWTRAFSLGNGPYYLYAFHFGTSFGPNLRELHTETMRTLLARHWLALSVAGAVAGVTGTVYLRLIVDALRRPQHRYELLLLMVFPLGSLAGPLAYAMWTDFPLHPRHLLFIWPFVPVVFALGFVRAPRLRPLLVMVAAVQLVAFANLLYQPQYWKDDERGAVRFAEAQSGNHAYVLGDVAPLYCLRVEGRPKTFTDFPAGTQDVWLVDNRAWEPENGRLRIELNRRMQSMGFASVGSHEDFRGIVLRHWKSTGS